MTKRRRQGWMLFLAGLLLLAGAWLLLKLLPGLDTTPWRAVPFLCLGVGCGLFGGGTGELLAVQAMKKHPELQKQNEIAERDERNVAIGNLAATRAFTLFSVLVPVTALMLWVLGQVTLVGMLVFVGIEVVAFIAYVAFIAKAQKTM